MSAAIKTQNQLAAVQQFNCTNCGSALEVLHPRAKYISCQYCGSVLDTNSETHQILKALDPPKKHRPFSFIKLGQTAYFEGLKHQVIARTRWRMDYKEYWAEEGETGYSDEIWIYDEWLLMAEDRTYFYLVEDKEGYKVAEEIVPELPTAFPQGLRMKLFNRHSLSVVREYGNAQAIHFEGESNYQIKVGDKIGFAMYKHRRIDYSSEWRYNEEGKISEIEFFREIPISRREVLEAFSDNDSVQEIRDTEKDWKFVFRVVQLTFFALLAGLFWSFSSGGSNIFNQSINTANLTGDGTVITNPIEIPQGGLFKLNIVASGMPANTDMSVAAYVLDADSVAINTLVQNFYHETGYDSDGSWTEKETNISKIFKLESGGTYYIQLFLDSQYSNMGTIYIGVNNGIMVSRYFVIGLLLILLPLGYAYMKKGSA